MTASVCVYVCVDDLGWMISLIDDRFAEHARRAGLEAYKVSDLKKAQQLFSEAIKYENNNCVHWCNRCQVHLAMRRFVAANNDADAALALGERLIFTLLRNIAFSVIKQIWTASSRHEPYPCLFKCK